MNNTQSWEEEFDEKFPDGSYEDMIKDFIRTLIQQAREEQREEDAKIAEEYNSDPLKGFTPGIIGIGKNTAAKAIATAIRKPL